MNDKQFDVQCSGLPSAIVQMDDKSLISKFFERLIMVSIHVSCVEIQANNSFIHVCVVHLLLCYILFTLCVHTTMFCPFIDL